MPLDVFLVEQSGEIMRPPLITIEAGEGGYMPKSGNEFVSIICLPHDIGGLAMVLARDDLAANVASREEVDVPELDELYAGDELQPEGFQVGWRVFRNKGRRLPFTVEFEGVQKGLELRHRIEDLAA